MQQLSATADPVSKPNAVQLASVFVLYYVGAMLGVALTVMPEGIAIIWPPNAVLLAALIRFQGARYPAIVALAMAAEVAADWPEFTVVEALLFGAVNVTEATLAFALLRAWRFDPKFAGPADLWKFVAAGPVLAAVVAAMLGALIYTEFRGGETGYLAFMQIWWFGDAMGLLIVTPLLLGFPPFGERSSQPVTFTIVDAVVWSGAAVVLMLFWFLPDRPGFRMSVGPVLLLPFVLFAAARYPQRWAAVAVALVTLDVVAAVALGRQPFGDLSPAMTAVQVQEFIFIMSLMAMGLASLLTQLRSGTRALELANRAANELTERLEARVEERTTELRYANEQLARLAAVDPLTDLYNRRGLLDIAQREFSLARRGARSLAVVMIDLDHFKNVNDQYGHLAGDEVLKHCAAVIARCVRSGDACGRYGGEEFVVVAPGIDLEGAGALAERIRCAIGAEPAATAAGPVNLTTSAGVTVLGDGDQSIDDIVQRADAALYEAKRAGRNRVVSAAPAQAYHGGM